MTEPALTRQAILRGAGDILTTQGRHIGDYYDADQARETGLPPASCRVCLLAAIAITAGLDLVLFIYQATVGDDPAELAAVAAAEAMCRHLDLIKPAQVDVDPELVLDSLYYWHDGHDALTPPTTAEVLAVLTATADALDAQETPR